VTPYPIHGGLLYLHPQAQVKRPNLLIAIVAVADNLTLASDNRRHGSGIRGLRPENWIA
jgi:predicted nucleic acid-binding protein